MRKLTLMLMVAMSSGMATFSQSLSNGFYRIKNYGSQHYAFVRDCTGSANSTSRQDLDAVEAWPNDDDLYSDPGSVVYLIKKGSSWDVTSQNTGIHAMTNSYVALYAAGQNWQLYCGGLYLYDVGCDKSAPGTAYGDVRTYVLGLSSVDMPSGSQNYKIWSVYALSTTSDNYFGFKPSVTAAGKYYAPFYAAFAYVPTNDQLKTWYVSQVDKVHGVAVIKQITDTVAASQPVFVECLGPAASDNKVDLFPEGGNLADSNLLKGTYFCNGERSDKVHTGDQAVVPFDASSMRVLGTDADGNLAFVSESENLVSTAYYINNTQQEGLCIPHNTSYLTVDADCPASLVVMTEAEYDDYVQNGLINVVVDRNVNTDVYSISGVRKDHVQENQLLIIGGKKVYNK